MNKNKLIALSSPLVFLVFGIWIRVSTMSMTKRDSVFPNLVAYMVIVVSIIDLIFVYRKTEHKNRFQGVNTRYHIVKDTGVIQSILPIKR